MDQIDELTVGGLKGFAKTQRVKFAQPNGENGSGLTILVGPNNGGKSTVIDSLRYIGGNQLTQFSDDKRNHEFGDRVEMQLSWVSGLTKGLRSVRSGTARTEFTGNDARQFRDIVVVPSRRTFQAHFSPTSPVTRQSYANDYLPPTSKSQPIDQFIGRLVMIHDDQTARSEFDKVLGRVLDPVPDWSIDLSGSGQAYIKVRSNDGNRFHNSEGLGDGIISLLFIVDSLYDSSQSSTIVIDEPELSLHPELQRKLRLLISEYARDRQIVYSTHSPYFVNWDDIAAGAEMVRVRKIADGSVEIRQVSRETLEGVVRLASDINNPHVLGLDAAEVFFLDDRVVLLEGQEDVVLLPLALNDVGKSLSGSVFGWGVGGAEKMSTIVSLLRELGYTSVVGILDNDKTDNLAALRSQFPDFAFECIPADDIRTKKAQGSRAEKLGLLDKSQNVRAEYVNDFCSLIDRCNSYFRREHLSVINPPEPLSE